MGLRRVMAAVQPGLSAPVARQPVRAPAPVPRWRRDDGGERNLLRRMPVRDSLQVQEPRSRLPDADAQLPVALQPARASHAPSEREYGQPDRHSMGSDGCERERPSGEAD